MGKLIYFAGLIGGFGCSILVVDKFGWLIGTFIATSAIISGALLWEGSKNI